MVQSVENLGGGYGRKVGCVGELCTLQDYNTRMKCRQSDALEATSVTHQIKGEDGTMTGIQQVRPTLFHMSSCFIYFLLSDVNQVDCVLIIF